MPRKGGGKRGFMKAARRGAVGDAESAVEQPDEAGSDCAEQSNVHVERNSLVNGTDLATHDDAAGHVQEKPVQGGTGVPIKVAEVVKASELKEKHGEDADDVSERSQESRGQMLQRHKREVKELKEQAKRAGKKGKDEFMTKEDALQLRHADEVAALGTAPSMHEEVEMHSPSEASQAHQPSGPPKKSKGQRRKEKQAAEEAAREASIQAELAALGESSRAAEERVLADTLRPLGLCLHDIPADGNCMYHALAHQLQLRGYEDRLQGEQSTTAHLALRRKAAEHVRANTALFQPFIVDEADQRSPGEQVDGYCNGVEGNEWGTQIELQALVAALRVPIQVYSSDFPVVEMGEEHAAEGKPPLQLCYLQHAYESGAHYNSCVALSAQQ